MGQALYRKYRSRSLDEIIGQSHITTILKRAIDANRIAHAYLLTGPKGVGKTSIARILAHEINKLPYSDESSHLDIVEIDAASNNSVEDIRDLRERVQIAPSSAEKKIYIIDEVHMLSKSAFNALLKTLEEPPEHVVFILATTDVDKLPATILSRVQRFNFRAAIPADNAKHLRTIADAEGIAIDDDALSLIAERSDGSFRNSVSLLDQLRHASDDSI
ncbi:MAG: DNA polymerase III subunit gamma/tau, partial [Candidatus Saccharimonas aalborgensis]